MSKTAKFNTTVVLGSSSYPPGASVPIGGKNGLSESEAKTFDEVFGPWEPKEGEAAADSDLAARLAELEAERGPLRAALKAAESERDRLRAELKARPTAEQLADEKARREQAEEDNGVLAGQIETLNAEIEKLKASGGT